MSLYIDPAAAGKIIKRKSRKSVIQGVLLVILAAPLYWITTTIPDHNSTLYMFCFVFGIVLLAVGLIKFFVGGNERIYAPTGSVIRSYSLCLDGLSGERLAELIDRNRFDELYTAGRKENGPVRLDVCRSDDDNFLSLQVLQYVPYNYEKVGPAYWYEAEEAQRAAAGVGKPVK